MHTEDTTSNSILMSLLKSSKDFGTLDEDVLTAMLSHLVIKSVEGGNKVVEEGTFADHMFIVVSGRLRVSRVDHQGELLLYNEVLPGECVGETAMLLEQPRTADIFALRDSKLAVLSKDSFNQLLQQYPIAMNKSIVNAVYRHLRHQSRITERKRAQSFLMIPLHQQVDLLLVAQQLESSFNRLGKTKVLARDGLLQAGVDRVAELDSIESEYDFIIYLGEVSDSEVNLRLLHQSDQLVFVADGNAEPDVCAMEKTLSEDPSFQLIRKHLVLHFEAHEQKSSSRITWRKGRELERVYPVRQANLEDFARVVRFLTGNAVGLVLGGGGARGFAHIGVLKAFKENNIPVDIVGGNSMGAVIGACYAIGMDLQQIHSRILDLNKNGLKLTFPLISLMSNTNLEHAFIEGLGDSNIEELWLPFFAAACNLSKAQTTVLDQGPLWQAVMASNSPAGLFPPVVKNGELLVDGAILENVPVEAMRLRLGTSLERRRGNGKVIAVDVDLKEDLLVPEALEKLTNASKVQSWFKQEQDKLPGIIDILMQVAHIGGIAKGHNAKFSSDIYLQPSLADYGMMDYKKAEEIIQAGYDYTLEQIKGWSWHGKI